MHPLKISAIMQDGRVAGTEPWFPLDGVLSSMWIRREFPELAYMPIEDTSKIIDAELPFERRGRGNDWYWACSFNQGRKLGEYVTYWHKRQDDAFERYIEFGKRRGKIDHKSGRFKAYRMPLVIQLFDRLIWYAVGDLEAVRDLCHRVTHIGKKPAQGYGAVDRWIVEPFDKDWSEYGPDGQVMRAIPVRDGESMRPGTKYANWKIRPPYWESSRARVCKMPKEGHQVEGFALKEGDSNAND